MTLFKQIMITIVSFGFIIFVAVGILNFTTVNNYISTQLGTNAKHTANSLGLAIASTADPDDLSGVEAMINSMFDSGYYSMIKFVDADNNTLIENRQPLVVRDVPNWFVENIKLSAPVADSEIMLGWSKFGTLYVQSNTGIAYYELYNILKNVFYILTVMSLIALAVSYFGLKFIFIPLRKVQDQAEAILENRFIIQDKLPFTLDIKRMVLAMNSMVGKVKDIFEQGVKTIGKYEDLLYKDDQTGMFNRRYFQNKFNDYMASEEYSSGAMMMVSCKDLTALKSDLGFEKWQKIVIGIANSITKDGEDMLCARLNDNDFIVVAPGTSSAKLAQFGNKTMLAINKLFSEFKVSDEYFVNSAIAEFNPKNDLKTVMIALDTTLIRAKESGNFNVKIYEAGSEILLGKEQFRELILNSIQNGMFKFAGQKTISKTSDIEHCELFLRLVDTDGKWRMASYFMPMINELNFAAKIDIYVLNKVADMLKKKDLPQMPISINLGKDILNSMHYFAEIEKILKKIKQNSNHKIFIEIPNKDDIDINALIKFHQKLRELGIGVGFDHFGFDANSIERLRDISPDYVKIPVRNLIDFFGEENSGQKHSFDAMMRSKDIKIIAIGVENNEQKERLEALGIDSMQGVFIDNIQNIG